MPRPTKKPADTPRLVAVEVPKVQRTSRASRYDAELLDAALEMLKTQSVNLDGNEGQDTRTKARRLANTARRALIERGTLKAELLSARVYSEDAGKTWTYGLTLSTEPATAVEAA